MAAMRHTPFFFVLYLFLCAQQSLASHFERHGDSWTPQYVLYATAANISVDCASRYSVLLNGTSPGPPLYMQEGKTTWVRVYNDLVDANVTVHWHGLSQRTAPFSDGTPLVSQWPIPPGEFFDYEIHPEVGDAGTYFYHSHVSFQEISAQGPLIVEECDADPPFAYDDELLIMFGDYYNKTDTTIEEGLLADPFIWSGETNALLINGQSGTSSPSNATDATCAPAVFTVSPGKKYRIRFIGSTAISLITLGIEGHSSLQVIEADGAYTQPAEVDHMQVGPGQRFSALLQTMTAEELQAAGKTSFWIQFENRGRPANVSGYALLQYDSGSQSLPTSLPTKPPLTLPQTVNDWLEYTLTPLDPAAEAFPTAADVTRTVYITVEQQIVDGPGYINKTINGSLEWAENGNVWQNNRTVYSPYLVDIYLNGQAAIPNYEAALSNGGWDPVTRAFPAKIGEILDIVWQGNIGPTGGWENHPFHAHGRHYWDLGSGAGLYNATENEARLEGYTPVRRDTTMIYAYENTTTMSVSAAGWRAWRLNVSDAGAWMMHCHILQHMIMGMQTVWVFGDAADITGAYPEPYITGYLNYGGSAYGNDTYYPMVYHHFD